MRQIFIDLALPEGTEIHAGITGTVTTAAFDSVYGNYIVIKSADGIEMKYAHCATLLFTAGQREKLVLAILSESATLRILSQSRSLWRV